jgi:hypothetical protein
MDNIEVEEYNNWYLVRTENDLSPFAKHVTTMIVRHIPEKCNVFAILEIDCKVKVFSYSKLLQQELKSRKHSMDRVVDTVHNACNGIKGILFQKQEFAEQFAANRNYEKLIKVIKNGSFNND